MLRRSNGSISNAVEPSEKRGAGMGDPHAVVRCRQQQRWLRWRYPNVRAAGGCEDNGAGSSVLAMFDSLVSFGWVMMVR